MTLQPRRTNLVRHVFYSLAFLGLGYSTWACSEHEWTEPAGIVPDRIHGLQGLARAASVQPVGAVDRSTPEWRPPDASGFRRASISVRQSQVRRKIPASGPKPMVQLRRGQALAFARRASKMSSIGRAAPTCSTTDLIPFERFRKDNTVK